MRTILIACAFAVMTLSWAHSQQVQTINVSDQLVALPVAANDLLSQSEPTLAFENAENFIKNAIGATNYHGEDCVIHVAKWKDGSSLDSQNWYVFSKGRGGSIKPWKESDYKAARIFGSRKLLFIYIYQNVTQTAQQAIGYKITVTYKQPANLQNLQSLVAFLLPGANAPVAPTTMFNYKMLNVQYVPSDMKFSALLGADAAQKEISSLTFDNESRYWWDIAVAIPLKSYKDIELDNNSGTITAKAITRQNAFATFTVYPLPVDTKKPQLLYVPNFMFGMPLSGKPLDQFLVAGGLGLNKINAFAGIEIERRSIVETGVVANSPSDRWIRKFTYGINIPLRQLLDAVKNKK